MQTVRFREHVQVEVVDEVRVFLLSDASVTIIDDPATARVAAAVDGARTPADIVMALADRLAPVTVLTELERLRRAGHLVDGPAAGGPVGAWLESFGRSGDGLAAAAAGLRVTVADLVGTGGGDVAHAVAQAVTALGCPVDVVAGLPAADTAGLVVALVPDYLSAELRRFDADRRRHGLDWLPAKPVGREVWVGPWFSGGAAGCWECLAERLCANRQVERYVAGKLGRGLPQVHPSGMAPGAQGVPASLVAAEVHARLTGAPARLDGVLLTFDPTRPALDSHVLVVQPQCRTCGDATLARATDEVRLGAGVPVGGRDGGYRTCTPEQTLARLAHHVSPHLGAVSKLESLGTDEDGVTYSFAAGHNFAMVHDNMELLRSNLRGQSGGKGRTEPQARASAVCEALERFSGVWTPDVPAVRKAFSELDTRAVHPAEVLMFSADQYADRQRWNADPRHRLHRIPEPFDVDRPVDFTPARSLTHGETVLVPAGLVWFGQPDLAEHQYAITDSNGGAAGNVLEEAVLQGLCEVYERDAVALWWYNRVHRAGVDLDSFEQPYVQVMRDFYARMDRDVWVLDLSTDLSVPVFAAFSRRHHEVQDLMVGFGAHPDADIALLRALTELNQFLPFVSSRDAEGRTRYRTNDPATLEWCRTATVEGEPWVAPHGPAVTADTLRRDLPTTITDTVRWCVDDLAAHGIETLVVNQTRPDIELAVAKVIAPSMRHFWRRTGPGRLYDVPVALGWLDAPTPEADVNPRGVFF